MTPETLGYLRDVLAGWLCGVAFWTVVFVVFWLFS